MSDPRLADALARLEKHTELHLPLRRGDLLGRLLLRFLWRRQLKWQVETNLATRDAISALHEMAGPGLVRSETLYHELAVLHRNDQNLMAGLNQRLHSSIGRIQTDLSDLRLQFAEKLEESNSVEARLKELEKQVGELASAARDARFRHVQFDLFMDEARPTGSDRQSETATDAVPDRNSFLELAVTALLDGPVETARAARTSFLPIVTAAREKGATGPVVDMAPWRGEWWEVLNAADIRYRTASANDLVRTHCSAVGCPVDEGDPLQLLVEARPRSLGAVTAFRYVERQEPAQLARFIDLASAALQPGGVLIIETPSVDTPDFHLDPFARRPVHPDLLRFLVEAAGFSHSEIESPEQGDRYSLYAWR